MAADLNLPATSQSDIAYAQSGRDNQIELVKQTGAFDNPVAGMIRFGTNKWEKWTGAAWVDLASTYAMNVATVAGLAPGHLTGSLPISDGALNETLNADMVDGAHAGVSAGNVLVLDGSGKVPAGNIPNTTITPGTYRSTTYGADGRATGGTNPTSIAAYGLTDAANIAGSTSQKFNVQPGNAPNHAVCIDDVQRGFNNVLSVTGTNTYAGSLAPAVSSYSQMWGPFLVGQGGSDNTGASTLNFNGLGAITLQHADGSALRAGDFKAGGWYLVSLFYTGVLGTSAFLLHTKIVRPSYGKQACPVMAPAMIPRATNGCSALQTIAGGSNQADVYVLDFDPAAAEFAHFQIAMPPSWNEGPITFKMYWRHGSTSVNFNAIWGIRAVAAGNADALPATLGSAVVVTDTGGTADTLYVTDESAALTIAGSPQAGDLVEFLVFRDAAGGGDNLAIDARLLGAVIFFTTDTETDA